MVGRPRLARRVRPIATTAARLCKWSMEIPVSQYRQVCGPRVLRVRTAPRGRGMNGAVVCRSRCRQWADGAGPRTAASCAPIAVKVATTFATVAQMNSTIYTLTLEN